MHLVILDILSINNKNFCDIGTKLFSLQVFLKHNNFKCCAKYKSPSNGKLLLNLTVRYIVTWYSMRAERKFKIERDDVPCIKENKTFYLKYYVQEITTQQS